MYGFGHSLWSARISCQRKCTFDSMWNFFTNTFLSNALCIAVASERLSRFNTRLSNSYEIVGSTSHDLLDALARCHCHEAATRAINAADLLHPYIVIQRGKVRESRGWMEKLRLDDRPACVVRLPVENNTASVRQVLQSYGNKVASARVEASVFAQVAPVDYRPLVPFWFPSLSFQFCCWADRLIAPACQQSVRSSANDFSFSLSYCQPGEKIITEMPIE